MNVHTYELLYLGNGDDSRIFHLWRSPCLDISTSLSSPLTRPAPTMSWNLPSLSRERSDLLPRPADTVVHLSRRCSCSCQYSLLWYVFHFPCSTVAVYTRTILCWLLSSHYEKGNAQGILGLCDFCWSSNWKLKCNIRLAWPCLSRVTHNYGNSSHLCHMTGATTDNKVVFSHTLKVPTVFLDSWIII